MLKREEDLINVHTEYKTFLCRRVASTLTLLFTTSYPHCWLKQYPFTENGLG